MNTVNFEQAGGFPLTQDTLGFMQRTNKDSFQALAAVFATLCSGQHIILSGCADNGNSVDSGVVYVNGEIMPFQAGTKSVYVVLVEEKTAVVYKDGSSKYAYFNRYAKFGGAQCKFLGARLSAFPPPCPQAMFTLGLRRLKSPPTPQARWER